MSEEDKPTKGELIQQTIAYQLHNRKVVSVSDLKDPDFSFVNASDYLVDKIVREQLKKDKTLRKVKIYKKVYFGEPEVMNDLESAIYGVIERKV